MSSNATIVKAVNKELGKFTVNRYEPHIPYGTIMKFLEDQGFKPLDADEVPFILCGKDGRVTVEFVLDSQPNHLYYLHMTWHRMDSGNYEAVAYFDSTSKKRAMQDR